MKKWSLSFKVYFLLGLFAAGSIIISFMGISQMSDLNDDITAIIDGPTARLKNTLELKSLFYLQILYERNVILEQDSELMKAHVANLNQGHEEILKLHSEAIKIASEEAKKDWEAFLDQYQDWFKITMEETVPLGLKNQMTEAYAISLSKGRPIRLKVEKICEGLVQRNINFLRSEEERTTVDYHQARNMMIAISASIIICGLLLAYFIMTNLNKSISKVIENLTDSSNEVTSAAQQIASSSEELSQAATEQASSLEETSSSIEEMNSMVQKNAENAKRASEISTQSSKSAQKGKEVVGDMIKAIDEINTSNNTIMEQVNESNQKISDIVKVIAEIGNKTKVINDIVFQTKLLSFNASVEAARAGEHGKGFAVVAEEVGNLAQMSGNAAKEISSMLEGSIQKVEGIVNETKQKVGSIIIEGKSKIEFGTSIAQQCGQVLDEIVENVSTVTHMANEISTACQEQSSGVQEITKAMSQLDQVTQTNAATSEEAASSAEELSSQSESLRATVAMLVQNINGGDGQEQTFAPKAQVRTAAKRPEVRATNVYPMKKQVARHPQRLKKAAGAESMVPSEDDPRFEEV